MLSLDERTRKSGPRPRGKGRGVRPCSVLDAPSGLGLGRVGVGELPAALRAAGLLEGIGDARYAGCVPVRPHTSHRDGPTGLLNPDGIRAFALDLAERLAFTLDLGHFPLVLGGDCSILLGSMLALRRRGRFGLFFLDGHADFYSPESEPNGEVASMELALTAGYGPAALSDIEGRSPLVREDDVVLFGCRDLEQAVADGSPDVRGTGMRVFDLAAVCALGARQAARQALAVLEAGGCEGFWVHLDADALHDDVMPAVDYRLPDGLWPEELEEVLGIVLATPLAVGMEVTIYNPALDSPQRAAARTLARAVTAALAGRAD